MKTCIGDSMSICLGPLGFAELLFLFLVSSQIAQSVEAYLLVWQSKAYI